MKKIDALRTLVEATNGLFFSVVFIKKDGTERKMTCRNGVVKHLKGGVSTTSHCDWLITVFDAQKNAYRNINLATLKEFKCGEMKWVAEE